MCYKFAIMLNKAALPRQNILLNQIIQLLPVWFINLVLKSEDL